MPSAGLPFQIIYGIFSLPSSLVLFLVGVNPFPSFARYHLVLVVVPSSFGVSSSYYV
jgi:hypothetical protein